jgi:hypothetical protein
MALIDLQAFIIERLQTVDNTLDLTPGSPYDVRVVQPILRRLGTDPFTVDIGLFIQTTLNQQFPDLPTKEGDAITDLLIKAGIVLWNPIVREILRVANATSFRDPTLLTVDEAEALGANLFALREIGEFARGVVRIYFAQPQSVSVSPSNFVSGSGGLHFFPTEIQSIRVEEMLLNLEGSLYFFDINVIAEQAGDQYNIGPDEVVTIANIASAVRVTNKVRFRAGTPDEDAVTFVDRIGQSLTERSMVTQRGVIAKATKEFPEVTRVNVIGFNDPEMQRDVITGGGLGPIIGAGTGMFATPDGESAVATRRISTAEFVDFIALIGPTGRAAQSFVLTLHSAFLPASLPLVRDLVVRKVIDGQTLDLEDQVLLFTATDVRWVLRKKSLTLSGIPGGILFPNTAEGTVSIPDNQVHIGGTTDIYVRGQDFDSSTLIVANLVDDKPLLRGVKNVFSSTTQFRLDDFVLGTNYSVDDATYTALAEAATQNLSIQILDPVNAGSYRILAVTQTPGFSPVLVITPPVTVVAGNYRWRISSSLFIDLVEPKETKVDGSDLRTVQGQDIVDTVGGIDFDSFGVGPDDILRITSGGSIEDDYVVAQVLAPFFTKVKVDRNLPASVNGAKYSIFRPNPTGGIVPPFIRLNSIDLLDTSSQPVGTTIPYSAPVDVRSNGFANSAHGTKADVTDGVLGIVSVQLTAGANVAGLSLTFYWADPVVVTFGVTFVGGNPIPLATVVSQINTACSVATSGDITRLAVLLDNGTRVGILPVASNVRITAGTACTVLFGHPFSVPLTTRDVNSESTYGLGGWDALRPRLDFDFDVVQVIDGLQIGFYDDVVIATSPFVGGASDPLRTGQDFNPEVRRHVQVGARSLGTARVYFLDPTSFEVDQEALFTLTSADGAQLNFFPDPTNNYQRIPPLPSGVKPIDGTTGGALAVRVLESLTTDFIAKGIRVGDLLVIDYIPLLGTVVLADPIATLNVKTLVLSINGGADKTIIFIHDSGAIPAGDVSRQGAIDQINKTVGQVICTLDVTNKVKFNPDASIIVRPTGTANALLGFSVLADQNNDSPNKGTYSIEALDASPNRIRVDVATPFPTGATLTPNQQFKVLRAGLQRTVSTDMAKKLGTAGLYFFDVELVSQGTGDAYNIQAGLPLTVQGYRSDGYFITTDDANLSFSPVERAKLRLSRSILGVGVSDDPDNATQLAGQNIQLSYERSTLVNNVDNFARSETERVINESPLARHLIPYFVRFSLTYFGGSKEDVVIPDIESHINDLFPTDSLNVSALERICSNRGARSVDNPIDLVAVIHNFDRTITVERSQDKLNTGRLAAFIPDVIQVVRRIA